MKKNKNKNIDIEAELVATRNQLARALADYDNLKKRVEQEREVLGELMTARLVTRFLPIFDMFEQVQEHVNDSGLAIAINEFREKLKDEGVAQIEPKEGDEFSEETMEAIEVIEKPEMEGRVVDLSLKGYKMDDNILRYAKVIVGRKGNKNE